MCLIERMVDHKDQRIAILGSELGKIQTDALRCAGNHRQRMRIHDLPHADLCINGQKRNTSYTL
jgi:hypothetical protein